MSLQTRGAQTAAMLSSIAPPPNTAPRRLIRTGLTPSALAAGQGKGALHPPCQVPDGTGFYHILEFWVRGEAMSTQTAVFSSKFTPHRYPIQGKYERGDMAACPVCAPAPSAQPLKALSAIGRGNWALHPPCRAPDGTAFRQFLGLWVRG